MTYKIESISQAEYPVVVEVWEASVRATHQFLREEDIAYFKPLMLNEYLKAVQLRCVRNEVKEIIGFMGVEGRHLEMLFVHPAYRGMGIGKSLLTFSIQELNVNKVDVNEQNEQAVDFYKYVGFKTVSRSELDASGKPYPILHMELRK
ncbi:GNAT family N-acetyltransferase [Arenibacter sp. ARW7G5Y1]|uniref:GNAT family N-acetyltransferase n=1 Tax=Arenibacter sp. ARW7G5Y1 TaxID=2135619 RepID=UPI000D75AEF6|nr:GNAT family N-acetyltransferase [Arenibacter sp. ARW7G5Y1]PXX25920.1 putative acetyltransferase [Arenibacter sp. ARW7G5Y1]